MVSQTTFTQYTLRPAKATIVAFEVMIGCNSRMDCARESVKTSSDSADSNQSDEFKEKIPLHLKSLRKTQKFDFPKMLLQDFFKNFKTSFDASLWAFLKQFFNLNYVWRPQLTKNSNQRKSSPLLGGDFRVKKVGGVRVFPAYVIGA